MSAAAVSHLLSRALRKLDLLLDEPLPSTHNPKDEIRKILAALRTIYYGAKDVERQAAAMGKEEFKDWLKSLQGWLYAVDDVIDVIDVLQNHQTRYLYQIDNTYPPLDKINQHLEKLSSRVVGMEYWKGFSECLARFGAPNEIPTQLKLPIECFLLQETYKLGVDPLTQVWMALGFLFSDDAAHSPEFIARKYLKEIIKSPVHHVVEYAPGGVVRHIKREDALSEYTKAGGDTPWVIAKDNKESYGSPTYMIWDQDCLSRLSPDCVTERRAVRLFMVSPKKRASVEFLEDVVLCFPRLRVLGVGECDLEAHPERIGGMLHLRYLDAGRNPKMESLPDSICDLFFLLGFRCV